MQGGFNQHEVRLKQTCGVVRGHARREWRPEGSQMGHGSRLGVGMGHRAKLGSRGCWD